MNLPRFVVGHLATRKARRQQEALERQEAIERRKTKRLKEELERLPFQVLLEHIQECQVAEFERTGTKEGAEIQIKNFVNPHTGEKEAEIRVRHPGVEEVLTATFSQKARLKHREWSPCCQPT